MSFVWNSLPNHRYVASNTVIRHEVVLPHGMVGKVLVQLGSNVVTNTVVARVTPIKDYVLIDAASILQLRQRDKVMDKLFVQVGEPVTTVEALAGNNPNRGRRVYSPVNGEVAHIESGWILIKVYDEKTVEVHAGVNGNVVAIIPNRGVIIESHVMIVQGVWGNERYAEGILKREPEEGLKRVKQDALDNEWRDVLVITRQSLSYSMLQVLQHNAVAGVIAPSMDSTLLPLAHQVTYAILLTEGFGNMRLSNVVLKLLEETFTENSKNLQAIIHAYPPTAWRQTVS